MTTAQLQALKADIAANTNPTGASGIYQNTAVNAVPNNDDGNFAIAFWYNQLATPAFIVWRLRVPLGELGDAMVATEVAGLTTANLTRLQVYAEYSAAGINGSQNTSDGFDNIFSGAGGVGTRANLHIVWRRSALRFEKLYATGTGSDAVPATLVLQGNVSPSDVNTARNS
jgi:hypothetical protein